jgi:uncharacterized protein YndB with AHSA1/START domain
MTKPAAIAVQTFAASAEAVYDALLDREMIGRFMFGPLLRDEQVLHIRLDARIGGVFSYKVRRGESDIDHVGRFIELERPRRIAFSWSIAPETDASSVFIDIAPTPDGCRVALKHELDPAWAAFVDNARGSWEKMLAVLATLLAPG